MAECECLKTCPFFNDQMAEMPSMSSIIKQRYCMGSNVHCARHMVFRVLGRDAIPKDLYPSQVERADEILGHR
ncbi:MAG: hypothetical protein U1E08_08730 [Coriobacteriia bacterium]|nr:hypothetical protein [Coriobacteriia bacterium]